VRVFTTRTTDPQKAIEPSRESTSPPRDPVRRTYPNEALVFDTETLPGPAQNIRFLVWRYYRDPHHRMPAHTCVEEGIAYPDEIDADSRRLLEAFVETHDAATSPGFASRLLLKPLSWWINQRFYGYGHDHRDRCDLVGFNLLFDLGRLARYWAPAKGDYRGGFSLGFAGRYDAAGKWHDTKYRPRITLRAIDPRRTLLRWAGQIRNDPDRQRGRGRFVDLRALAFALTDRSHTLETACAAFGDRYEKHQVDYNVLSDELVAYALDDVRHSSTLYRNCLAELREHPGVDLQPHRLFSPAGVGSRYLEAIGLSRPLVKFTALTGRQLGWDRGRALRSTIAPDQARGDLDPAVLGWAMSAFYGGRAEARVVRTPVPVAVVDFTSMYPSVNALLGTWPLLCAERLDPVDVTDQTRTLLGDPALLARCATRELWQQLGVTLVELRPDGDVLPVRADYDPHSAGYGIAVNPLSYDGTLWYMLPDVVAAALLNPLDDHKTTAPEIVRAIRLVPRGQQRGLQPVRLRGGRTIDPTRDDPFVAMIEERQAVLRDETLDEETRKRVERFLKITANATSYGVLARFDRRPAIGRSKLSVYGPDPDPRQVTGRLAPEDPGPFCFPPVAASITAAARLMLAILERHVRDAGGQYAFCDTDSMAVVATADGAQIDCQTHHGDTLTALSWDTVREIVARFDALNPYDRALVPSPWKEVAASLTEPLSCYAISAKRYCLYRHTANDLELVAAVDQEEADPESPSESERQLADWSEHGLGLYLDPTATDPDRPLRDNAGRRLWTGQAWTWILNNALRRDTALPGWSKRLALTRFTITSPTVAYWFRGYNASRPNEDAIRPGSFGLLAHPIGITTPKTGPPAATYEPNPDRWEHLDWYDRHTGKPTSVIALDDRSDPEHRARALHRGDIPVATLAEILHSYHHRPEYKSLTPDRQPTRRDTTGLLLRRPVTSTPTSTELTGKEGNNLEQRLTGEQTDPADYLNLYGARADTWPATLDVLKRIGVAEIRRQTGFSRSSIYDVLSGEARPHPRRRPAYEAVARQLGRPCAPDTD
jgi:hypothetical protein